CPPKAYPTGLALETDAPHLGILAWLNGHGITLARLLYTADPEKGDGEKALIPEVGRQLSPWALKPYLGMTDSAMYLQEYEIDFGATLGRNVFHLEREATLCQSFAIPPNWTRY